MAYDPALIPLGSPFERYMRHFDVPYEPFDFCLTWRDPNPAVRALVASTMLREEPRLHRHDPWFVRDIIVVPALCRMGLPKNYLNLECALPNWLAELLETKTEEVQTLSKWDWHVGPLSISADFVAAVKSVIEELTGWPFDPNRRPKLYPREKLLYDAIIMAAVTDASASSFKSASYFEAAGYRLGISAADVERTVRSVGAWLSSADTNTLTMWHAANDRVSEEMRKLDQADNHSKPTS